MFFFRECKFFWSHIQEQLKKQYKELWFRMETLQKVCWCLKIQGNNEIFRTSLIKSKHWYQPHVATLYSVLNRFDTLIQNKINTGKVCRNIYVLRKWTSRLNVLYWSSAPYRIDINNYFIIHNLAFVDTSMLFAVIPF